MGFLVQSLKPSCLLVDDSGSGNGRLFIGEHAGSTAVPYTRSPMRRIAAAQSFNKRRTPRQQRRNIQPSRQGAEYPPATFQATGDERIRNRRVTRFEQ